ncbi:hypothetical protein QBC39DRAFT_254113 [Podospora conica]|nr:hypothetical protein QBC39DRAFT_254113 [Schizothecium conicum]
MLLPLILPLALLGHGVAAQDGAPAANLDDYYRQWMERVTRVPTAAMMQCPASCSSAGSDTSAWDLYPDAARMAVCSEPVLFTMMVDTDAAPTALRVCTASDADLRVPAAAPSSNTDEVCAPALEAEQTSPLRLASTGGSSSTQAPQAANSSDIISALDHASAFLARTPPACNSNPIAFAQAGKAVVGLYYGAQVHRQGIPSEVIDRVLSHLETAASPASSFVVELCDPGAQYGADYTVGVVVSTDGDVHGVQQSVRKWFKGSCLAGASADVLGESLTFLAPAPAAADVVPAAGSEFFFPRGLGRRQDYCSNVKKVQTGNNCTYIADKRCTISLTKFLEYNPGINCTNLQIDQKVCCNAGGVPPPDPPAPEVPAPDPYCTNWKTVGQGETCAHIADKRCTVSLSTFQSRNPHLSCPSPAVGQTFCCNQGRVPPANVCSNSKTVDEGNTCLHIADKRCTISIAKFVEYNPQLNCSLLKLGEPFCCNLGRVPPPGPPPNADGTCQTAMVVSNDNCTTLSTKCGIKGDYISQFNPNPLFCSTLQVDQTYCCGTGKLPDLRPKKNADGSCAVYTVAANNTCGSIAVRHQLSVDDLFKFNNNTWGWKGCGQTDLWPDQKICLSDGTPPMPAVIGNAVCGPMVPGTQRPTDGTPLHRLNPCPLNVCCNHWGQCGLNQDFCTVTQSPTGAPGTTMCISNCETGIIKSNPPPSSQIRIAYFEAWNDNRPCLRMRVDRIDKSKYTHVHFAFADITPDTFQVDISKMQYQFDIFKTMTGIKKIISFGGWAFSAEAPTYQILRDAVKPANRDRFRDNLLRFVQEHNLDGIDLDWEYPGAPDLPGIPAADPNEGWDYAVLLSSLKALLPSPKTLSFAAPASYWYLKAFPIELIAQYVDYVVYMTYDFHGQWDVGNKWSMDGCMEGNCLRSHVNMTQTNSALSMITRAGMPSHKVIVGVTSYGRSFRMHQPGCVGPDCRFIGTNKFSYAAPGRCTGTRGYIADAEINEIIRTNPSAVTWTSDQTDYLVYDEFNWVAYMSPTNKASREAYYQSQAMGGSTDWAVDLQSFDWDSETPYTANAVFIGPPVYDQNKVQCQPPCNLVLPPVRLASDTVISIPPYTTSLEVGSTVGTSFVVTTTTITIVVAPITTREIQQSNVEVTHGQTGGFIPTPSVPVPRPTYTVTNGHGVATARTLTLPPWPAITNGPPSRWNSIPGPWVDSPPAPGSGDGSGRFSLITVVVAAAPTTRVISWSTPPSSVVTCPPSTFALQNPATTITLSQCTGVATIGWACPRPTTVTFAGPSTATLTAHCTPFATAGGSWGTLPAPTGGQAPASWPLVFPCQKGMRKHYIKEQDAFITLGKCPANHMTTLDPNCGAPTTTVRIEENPTKSFVLGCTLFTGTGTRPPTDAPLPTYTTWDGELEWEDSEEGDDDEDVDVDGKSTCKLWFFNICLRFGGWWWKFPSGVYIRGPPPFNRIKWPGPLPVTVFPSIPGPWPTITIGWDKRLTYPTLKPTASCTTQTADICRTTTTLDIKTVDGTRTTSTRSQSTCDTIRGCRVNDDDWETTTTKSCTRLANRGLATVEATPTPTSEPLIQARAGEQTCEVEDVIVYPMDFRVSAQLRAVLDQPIGPADPGQTFRDKSTIIGVGPEDDYVAFIYFRGIDKNTADDWRDNQRAFGMQHVRYVKDEFRPNSQVVSRRGVHEGREQRNKTLNARAPDLDLDMFNRRWDHTFMSVPPGVFLEDGDYWLPEEESMPDYGAPMWMTGFDTSRCQGQFIYMVEEDIDTSHSVSDAAGVLAGALANGCRQQFNTAQIRRLNPVQLEPQLPLPAVSVPGHGTEVGSKLVGSDLGLCTNAQLVHVPTILGRLLEEELVLPLITILQEVTQQGADRARRTVINVSLASDMTGGQVTHQAHEDILRKCAKPTTPLYVCYYTRFNLLGASHRFRS